MVDITTRAVKGARLTHAEMDDNFINLKAGVEAHAAAADPHGDRAYASAQDAAHVSAADPHGDRAYSDAQLSTGLATKQNTLVSGTNIKTVNGGSLLGSGDLVIQGLPKRVSFVDTAPGTANTVAGTSNFVLGSGNNIASNDLNITVLGSDLVTSAPTSNNVANYVGVLGTSKVVLGDIKFGAVIASGDGSNATMRLGGAYSGGQTGFNLPVNCALIAAGGNSVIDNSYNLNGVCVNNVVMAGSGNILGGARGVIVGAAGGTINSGSGNVILGHEGATITNSTGYNVAMGGRYNGVNITGIGNLVLNGGSATVSGSYNIGQSYATQISGSNCIYNTYQGSVGGSYNIAVGNSVTVYGGSYNLLIGDYASIGGWQNTNYSVNVGQRASGFMESYCYTVAGQTSSSFGDESKSIRALASGHTTNATPMNLQVPYTGTTFAIERRFDSQNGKHGGVVITATVIGVQRGAANANVYMRKFRQVYYGESYNAPTALGAITQEELKTVGSASAWNATFVTGVGYASAGIGIQVTGEAAKNIAWSATVEATQIWA